jgi:putative DNA primase/helicase
MENREILNKFIQLGLKIIKLKNNDKRPVQSWKTELNTPETLYKWKGNFGARMGSDSGNIVVIDLDQKELFDYFKDTPTLIVKSPNKGYHIYLRSKKPVNKIPSYLCKPIDIQGDGSYIVIPPSTINGKQYEIFKDEPLLEVNDAESFVANRLQEIDHKSKVNCMTSIKEFLGEPPNDFGKYTQYNCPFHKGDNTPSLTVYENGIKCFGCGWSGNFDSFLTKFKNWSAPEIKDYYTKNNLVQVGMEESEWNLETKKEKQIKALAEQVECDWTIVRDVETEDLFIYIPEHNLFVELTPIMLGKLILDEYSLRVSIDDIKKVMTFFYDVRQHQKEYISFENGLLNLETTIFTKATPDIFTKYHIPYNFNTSSYSEEFDKTLKQILVDDSGEDKYKFFLQMLGYLFTDDNRYHKIFFLTGTGANGKSTLMALVRAIFSRYVASVPLHNMGTNFGLEPLLNKKINILYDIPQKSIPDTGIIKAITGEDAVAIDRKYKSTINTVLPVKIVATGNVLPRIGQEGYAFFRRVSHIELLNTFHTPDPHVVDRMVNDIKGLEWLICKSIMEFSKVKTEGWAIQRSVTETTESYLKLSEPELYIAKRTFEQAPDTNIFTRREVVNIFRFLMKEEGFKVPGNHRPFYDAMREIGAEDTKRSVNGFSERVFIGIRLKKDVKLPKDVLGYVKDNWNL